MNEPTPPLADCTLSVNQQATAHVAQLRRDAQALRVQVHAGEFNVHAD